MLQVPRISRIYLVGHKKHFRYRHLSICVQVTWSPQTGSYICSDLDSKLTLRPLSLAISKLLGPETLRYQHETGTHNSLVIGMSQPREICIYQHVTSGREYHDNLDILRHIRYVFTTLMTSFHQTTEIIIIQRNFYSKCALSDLQLSDNYKQCSNCTDVTDRQ